VNTHAYPLQEADLCIRCRHFPDPQYLVVVSLELTQYFVVSNVGKHIESLKNSYIITKGRKAGIN